MPRRRRPASYRAILDIAAPIMLGSLAQSAIYLTDSVFVGRLGAVPLAAVGLGGLLFYLLTTVGAGLAVALQILTARRLGQGRRRAVGRLFDNTLYLSLALAAVLAVLGYALTPWLATRLVAEAAVAAQMQLYLRAVVWALPASFLWHCLAGFFTGIGRTRIISLSTLLMTTANLLLNYGWVWGGLGLPRLGIAGSAWASVVSEAVGAAVLLLALGRPGLRPRYALLRHGPMRLVLRRLLLFGAPIVGKQLVETAGWFGFFVLVGELGSQALAVSNIVRSVYTVVSLPSLALASAIYTLTSRYLGQRRPELLAPVIARTVALSLLITLPAGLAIALLPVHIGGLFTSEPALNAALVPLAPVLTLILAVFAASNILYNSIIGLGGAGRAFQMEVLAIGAYLLAAYAAVHWLRVPLAGVWATELVYWLVLGGLAGGFLLVRRWRRLRAERVPRPALG
ncbi:MATE family efflux transporter [Hymenobacter sp. 15J16-1T3B]|uniref:MATE family efflux transporter n=1 Tax=Hymenobacter sp. 15J16-1T3B TaxID=2886941 RepID=UPI001D12EB84|nr:MATE family efflux transporter [Hymenobacter sp. 15J16-1T3B]MCC3156985.1 MATE family efflux transporter [Hymenobacter sp. 15J16-1T3B]